MSEALDFKRARDGELVEKSRCTWTGTIRRQVYRGSITSRESSVSMWSRSSSSIQEPAR